MSRATIRGLDIFCGVGGSSAGARGAGVSIVGGIDQCCLATAAYAANFPGAKVLTERLEHISGAEARRQFGKVDILLASPECTNHTCAKGSAPRSEASRATALQVVRLARALKPRWIVLENVIHMRPWSKYRALKAALVDLGYHVAEQVLDSSHFGVPQARRRLFLVADRDREPNLVGWRKKGRRPTVASILDRSTRWKMSPLLGNGRARDTLARARRARKALGNNSPFLLVYYGSDGSGGWQPVTRPLRTITTVDRFALVRPTADGHEMRMLQVPELKRAMGFTTEHQMDVGTRRDQVRLLGNAVCPPVMHAVVEALLDEVPSTSKINRAGF